MKTWEKQGKREGLAEVFDERRRKINVDKRDRTRRSQKTDTRKEKAMVHKRLARQMESNRKLDEKKEQSREGKLQRMMHERTINRPPSLKYICCTTHEKLTTASQPQ